MATTTLSLAQQLFDSSARLTRTKWKDPEMLAQEIFAIFRSVLDQVTADTRAESSSGNQTTGGGTTTTTTIGGVTVTKGDQTFNSGSSINFDAIDWPDQQASDREQATPSATTNPIALFGIVGDRIDGSTYYVTCYAKDPATSPPIARIPVRQGLIDPTDTIPAGTPVVVIVFLKSPAAPGGPFQVASARMQVPVFVVRQ